MKILFILSAMSVQSTATRNATAIAYNNAINNCKVKINCAFCKEKFFVRQYFRHLKQFHSASVQPNMCIWCCDFTWKQRDTSGVNNFEHRLECLNKRINPPVSELKLYLDNMDLTRYLNCEECDK